MDCRRGNYPLRQRLTLPTHPTHHHRTTMTTTTTLRFTIGSSFGGLCYYPENDAAKAFVPGKRRTLRPDEFVELINAGRPVEIGVATFVGKPLAWLAVTPAVEVAEKTLADAEDALRTLPDDCTLEQQVAASLVARIAEDGVTAANAVAAARANAFRPNA